MSQARGERGAIEALVARFADNVAELRSPQTKEATIRVQYLDPFFTLLGWDVSNEAGVPLDEQDVIIEPSIDVAERDRLRARRPDYLFRVGGQNQLTCEAKKPAVDIDCDHDAVFQTKRDAYSMGLPFAILTDFEHFRVYDTGYQPDHGLPGHGLVREFSLGFADYPAQWDVLRATFGRDAVAGGSLDRLRAAVRKTRAGQRIRGIDRQLFELRGDKPAGDAFLAQLELQRRLVAADLYAHNRGKFPDVNESRGSARLAEFTQRLLDRIVFMRICEDRNVVSYGVLRGIVEESGSQDRSLRDLLVRQFRQYDRDFNGYLFKPHDIETCEFTPSVLRDLIAQFYPPESRTNFATLPDDLLATVYERFLGSTIAVNRGRVEIERKPELRHADGVYYTPRFVVDSILRRVVAPKLVGKKPRDLLGGQLTILDPACGSGSFLIAAYDLLVGHCERAIASEPALAEIPKTRGKQRGGQGIAFQQTVVLATSEVGQTIKTEKVWRLTPDFKGQLLIDCIFGIDIDQQAVEVTIMSLYTKVLHNLPPDWRGISEHHLLPPLDNNIRCGNSLIDQDRLDAYAEELHGALFTGDDNVRFRINAFDWHSQTRGFGRILGGRGDTDKGFDCVIGNPPYIRVQELNKWAPQECQFYKWQYQSAAKGNYDIYVAFTERVLTGGNEARGLLKPDGALGFIMKHEWWKANYGAALRQLVSHHQLLASVVDFAHHQVFSGATTYTAIQVFRRGEPQLVDYARVNELTDGFALCTALDESTGAEVTHTVRRKVPHPASGIAPYSFAPPIKFASRDSCVALSAVAELAQGFKTGADKVFVVEVVHEGEAETTELSKVSARTYTIETAALRPLVKSEHMKAFEIAASPLRLIFPYALQGGGWKLMYPNEMAKTYPKLWGNYLPHMRTALDNRERGRFAGEHFYQFSRPQNFGPLSQRKIVSPDICKHPQMGWDDSGRIVFSGGAAGGVAIVPRNGISPTVLLGILNSSFSDAWIRANGTPFRGGYLNCEIRFIRDLPIKLPTTASEKKLAGRIELSVTQIMDDKRKLSSGGVSGDRDRRDVEGRIEAAERRIDADVMALYGVDRLPTDHTPGDES